MSRREGGGRGSRTRVTDSDFPIIITLCDCHFCVTEGGGGLKNDDFCVTQLDGPLSVFIGLFYNFKIGYTTDNESSNDRMHTTARNTIGK